MIVLSACGGGGGSSAIPSGPIPGGGSSLQSVQFSIVIPQSNGISPKYISVATKSAGIVVTPQGGAAMAPVVANCSSGTCSATVPAPAGTDTFAVNLYDGASASGNVLSQGSTTQSIVAGQANSVNVAFNGVVVSIGVTLGSASVTTGTPASIPVMVAAKDASGNTIVGT